MKIETARQIEEAAKVLDLDVKVRESYSGRGMMGRSTAGVIGSQTAILKAVAYAAFAAGRAGADDCDSLIDDLDLRWDSMGYDQIAY